MFGLGVPELVIILIIALVIFGPRKLPEIGQALGKGIREFKKSTSEIESQVKQDFSEPAAKESSKESSQESTKSEPSEESEKKE